jgi:hypothetical protein
MLLRLANFTSWVQSHIDLDSLFPKIKIYGDTHRALTAYSIHLKESNNLPATQVVCMHDRRSLQSRPPCQDFPGISQTTRSIMWDFFLRVEEACIFVRHFFLDPLLSNCFLNVSIFKNRILQFAYQLIIDLWYRKWFDAIRIINQFYIYFILKHKRETWTLHFFYIYLIRCRFQK